MVKPMTTPKEASKTSVVGWAAAAKAAGCSKAQVRRLVAKGALKCTRDDLGRHVFDAADLEALRPNEAREAPAEPVVEPSNGPSLASPVEGGTAQPLTDGAVAAFVFAALDRGSALTTIVVERAIEPATVGRLFAEWMKLKEVDVSAPSVPAVLADLGQRVAELEEVVNELDAEGSAQLKQLATSLARRARQIEDDPLAGLRSSWSCPCGGRGTVAAKVECTTCGHATSVGWFPEEEDR